MDELWTNLHVIDSSLLTTDMTQKSIASRVGILDFMNSHCKATHYMSTCSVSKSGDYSLVNVVSSQDCPLKFFLHYTICPTQLLNLKVKSINPFIVLTRPRSTDHHLLNVSRKVMECPFHHRHNLLGM